MQNCKKYAKNAKKNTKKAKQCRKCLSNHRAPLTAFDLSTSEPFLVPRKASPPAAQSSFFFKIRVARGRGKVVGPDPLGVGGGSG